MTSNFLDAIDNMSTDTYQNLKRAVEIGKWPDGKVLTSKQRDISLQAVIAYEQKFLPQEQHTGFIEPKKHNHCGSVDGEVADDDEQPLNWKH